VSLEHSTKCRMRGHGALTLLVGLEERHLSDQDMLHSSPALAFWPSGLT